LELCEVFYYTLGIYLIEKGYIVGSLRSKAEKILKVKIQDQEEESKKREASLLNLIKNEKSVSREIFQKKIQKERQTFQFNLLSAAKKGETLKIDILEINRSLDSENSEIKSAITYLPISQKVVSFLEDTNFDLVADEIIEDSELQTLYDFIVSNDLYPEWKVRSDTKDEKVKILYLEVNPLLSFKERKEALEEKRRKEQELKQYAMVLYEENVNRTQKLSRRKRLLNGLLTFFLTLYISMVFLTVVGAVVGILPMERLIDSFGFVAVGWVYYLVLEPHLFIFTLPVAFLISSVVALRRI